MIQVSNVGNVTIRISSMAMTDGSGTQWAVYPYLNDDPTLAHQSDNDQKIIRDLTINLWETKNSTQKDLTEAKGDAIVTLLNSVNHSKEWKNTDLGLKVSKIAVEDEGLVKYLEERYNIKNVESEAPKPAEAKG